jgi:hypothetical protein
MKEQYVGDVNDYRKYALLRHFAIECGLRVGVCWMLTPPDTGNRRPAGLGVCRALIACAREPRPSNVLQHDPVPGQRVRLDLARPVAEPVLNRLGDGRRGAGVDVAAGGHHALKLGATILRIFGALEELLPPLSGLRIAVVRDVAGQSHYYAIGITAAAYSLGDVNVQLHQ